MAPESNITSRVLDSLVSAGLMTADQVSHVQAQALERGVHVGKVLAERGLVSPIDIVSVLEKEMGVPQVDLSAYAPDEEALAHMPASMARGRQVLPLFEIDGMLTAAVADPMDVFLLDDLATELGLEMEPVLADGASFAAALDQYYPAGASEAPARVPAPVAVEEAAAELEPVVASDFFEEPVEEETQVVPVAPVGDVLPVETGTAPQIAAPQEIEPAPAPATPRIEEIAVAEPASQGPAGIDLDVLAVADSRKVAVLVADILDDAAKRGASKIHLLPYKDDFFLVYRVKDALDKVASAPLSMQGALIDGFKQFAKLGNVPASRPALGRVRTRLGDRDRVLTVSVVPTIAGQRLVVSITPFKPEPRTFAEIGMNDTEAKVLNVMVERGRGLLLVCAPVAGGASTTYYSLLAHAAAAGKTVYSVEQSVEYELPSVAQVMIEPGGPSPAAYIAAGMRQDTDIIAVDGLRAVEDVHLAVEAAGLGKLVIATFPAADIASGIRRMLDLGTEPHSLGAALSLGVGQRLVRKNCPNCSVETDGRLAARIPGAPAGLRDKAGSGCPNCGKSGYKGFTAIHELLPFGEPMRAAVGRGGSQAELAAAAAAAGMKPLVVSGLAKVMDGEVSAQELNRVLRFA